MSNMPLIKIQATTAGEICARYELNETSRSLLHDGMSPRAFVDALAANRLYAEGIEFMAYALPVREAIWWGCLCTQHACGDNLSGPDRAACSAAVEWVLRPSESSRAAAKAPAEAAKPPSPAGALAMAVGLTGGSLSPPDLPRVPPPPFAWSRYVAAAVKFAALKVAPARMAETRRLFLDLALSLAQGRHS